MPRKKKGKAPTPPVGRGGPPLRLTPERMGRIITAVRMGATYEIAAKMANVGRKTTTRWRQWGEAVKRKLTEEAAEAHEDLAMAAGDLVTESAGKLPWGEARAKAIEELPEAAALFFADLERVAEELERPAYHCDMYLQFVDALERANAEAELAAIMVVKHNIDGKKNWVTAMTFLERRFPERWRRKTDVQLEAGGHREERDTANGRAVAQAILQDPEATRLHNATLLRLGSGDSESPIAGGPGDGSDS